MLLRQPQRIGGIPMLKGLPKPRAVVIEWISENPG
jgi:hypothetical protein